MHKLVQIPRMKNNWVIKYVWVVRRNKRQTKILIWDRVKCPQFRDGGSCFYTFLGGFGQGLSFCP